MREPNQLATYLPQWIFFFEKSRNVEFFSSVKLFPFQKSFFIPVLSFGKKEKHFFVIPCLSGIFKVLLSCYQRGGWGQNTYPGFDCNQLMGHYHEWARDGPERLCDFLSSWVRFNQSEPLSTIICSMMLSWFYLYQQRC